MLNSQLNYQILKESSNQQSISSYIINKHLPLTYISSTITHIMSSKLDHSPVTNIPRNPQSFMLFILCIISN